MSLQTKCFYSFFSPYVPTDSSILRGMKICSVSENILVDTAYLFLVFSLKNVLWDTTHHLVLLVCDLPKKLFSVHSSVLKTF